MDEIRIEWSEMRMKRRGGPLKPILHSKGETRLDEKKRKAAIEAILFAMGDAGGGMQGSLRLSGKMRKPRVETDP